MTTLSGVRAVMAFVEDPEIAARWWSAQVAAALHSDEGFWWVDVGGVELGFHPADERKNPVGGSVVAYWSVESLDEARAEFLDAGCTPHRGPLQVGAGRRICQLVDPHGMVFGLDGP